MIARGVLYEHKARPQWGPGLVLCLAEGKADMAFADGEHRTIYKPELYLVEVEGEAPTPIPSSKPRRQTKPKRPAKPQQPAWPDEDLRRLFAEGLDDAEIASRLGRSYAAVRNRRWLLGLSRGRPNKIEEPVRRRIVELRQAGHTCGEIAKIVGRSPGGVESALVRSGVEPWGSRRHTWDDDEDQALADLVAMGLDDTEIAARLGRTRGAVWARRTQTLGHLYAARRRWTADEMAVLADMVAAGKSNNEIAAVLDRTPAAIRNQRGAL